MSILDKLAELEKAATEGPWWAFRGIWISSRSHEGQNLLKTRFVDDAEFIAALRNAAPHLIEVARAAHELKATCAGWVGPEMTPGGMRDLRNLFEVISRLEGCPNCGLGPEDHKLGGCP